MFAVLSLVLAKLQLRLFVIIFIVFFSEEMHLWMSELVDSRCIYRTAGCLPEIVHADIKVFLIN